MKLIIIIITSFYCTFFFAQGSFSDTLSTDNLNNWELISSFEFSENESIIFPIAYLYTNQDGNAIKFAKTDKNGSLQTSKTLTDINICRYSHYLTQKVVVKISDNRLVFPLIRELDTINFSGDSTRLYFIKTDTLGNILDSLLFDIPNGGKYDFKDSYVDTDSSFLLVGTIKQAFNNHLDVLLTRIDTNFNVIWHQRYGDVEEDIGQSLSKTSDGGYLIGGLHELPDGINRNCSIIKTDTGGNLEWQKYYGKPDNNHDGGMITVLDNDEFLLVSRHWRDGEYYSDLLLTKFNSQGDSLWSKLYQKANETEYPFAPPIVLENGDLILPALFYDSLTTNSPNGGTIGWILKVDSLGTTIWEKDLNFFKDSNSLQFVSYNDYYDIRQSEDGGFVLSGTMNRINLIDQETFVLLTKLDSNGCVISECANYSHIEENSTQSELVVYPNPSSSYINISGASEIYKSFYLIYSLDGRIVQSGTLKNRIDITFLNSGTYLINLQNGQENITLKFIKE